MKQSLIQQVANYIGCDKNTIITMARRACTLYKRYYIDKKSGGKREIYHPSKETKALQYAIIEFKLKNLPVHQCAAAYIKGKPSPLLQNASSHAPYKYTLRMDFSDFFPSIKPADLISCFPDKDQLSNEEREFLENSLFMEKHNKKILVIGAPSSPIISNIVMCSLDKEIKKKAESISPKNKYTRYADDIFFSTNKKGSCLNFYKKIFRLIESTNSPQLKINTKKTLFLSRGTKRTVTGLVICPNGDISIGRKNKDNIKKLIYKYKNGNSDNKSYLRGYLSFISDVEPSFLNRLSMKYTAETISELLS